MYYRYMPEKLSGLAPAIEVCPYGEPEPGTDWTTAAADCALAEESAYAYLRGGNGCMVVCLSDDEPQTVECACRNRAVQIINGVPICDDCADHWEKLTSFPAACVELLALGQLGEATLGNLSAHLPVDGRYPSSELGPWLNGDGTEAACPMSGAWARLNSDGTVDGETCSGYRYRITKTNVVLFASERADPAQSTCFVPSVCRWARLNGFKFPEDLRAKLIQFARSDAFLSERIFRDDIDEIRSAMLADLF